MFVRVISATSEYLTCLVEDDMSIMGAGRVCDGYVHIW